FGHIYNFLIMKKGYFVKKLPFISLLFLLFAFASCKKNNNNNNQVTPVATPTRLGLYETDSSIYKLLVIAISNIGTQPVNYGLVFDTGSGGMVIDANGVVPASMITSTGFNFTGDSTVVNGITITSQTQIVEYGNDAASIDKVYGNLAYASVTVGDRNGNIVIKRLPFFLYYKAIDAKGVQYAAHDFDVFGVNEEYDVVFPNNAYITSPFRYFDPGNGLTKGFKMAQLNAANFSYLGTYVPGAITLGLTASDLSSSSGFSMTQLNFYAGTGYPPIVPATVNYSSKPFSTEMLFDTGTDPFSYIEDPNFTGSITQLPAGTAITVGTTFGFSYNYTTSTVDNLTDVENPTTSGGTLSILGLEFFLNNEFMLDFANHKLGLKSN
ncbi:MAG: hypothetical protein ACHQIM_18255, partial [Sphingobacteriales bacterium]